MVFGKNLGYRMIFAMQMHGSEQITIETNLPENAIAKDFIEKLNIMLEAPLYRMEMVNKAMIKAQEEGQKKLELAKQAQEELKKREAEAIRNKKYKVN